MRKLVIAMCFVFLVITSLGCGAARKPEPTPPAPKTIVVPDVSKITFETIELEKSPEIVRALAKNLDGKHFATWTAVNGKNYVVVSQTKLTAGSAVEINEIERRVPANDFDWINVKLRYLADVPKLPTGQRADLEKPIVAVFSLDRAVNALGFEFERAPATPPPATQTPEAPKEQATEKGLRLNSPKPGERVKGPMQISGNVSGVDGTVRVRIKDSSGLTLAEKPVQVSGSRFSTSVNFSSPASEERGSVEAFVTGNGGIEKDMVSVPITILPNDSTETIGAP